jgi:hypothetical protein
MRYRYVGAASFLALLLALPAAAAPPKNPPLPPVDSDKIANGQFTGYLLTTPGTDRAFTLRVQYQDVQLKPNAQRTANNANNQANRQLQQIARLQQQMAKSKNPAQQMAQIQRLVAQMQVGQARAQQNLYTVVPRYQDVEFQAEENVKVRTMELPEQFDEKGNLKKYTKEELKQLKGKDKDLPGYESSFEALKEGQLIQVTLADHKAKKPASSSPGDKDKAKDKDAPEKDGKEKAALDNALVKDKDKGGPSLDKALDKDSKDSEKHKQVRLIVILKENPGPIPGTKPGKRGK